MAKASLVNREMGNGELLVRRLEERGIPLTAAFWLYMEEAEGYRLVLATEVVDSEGRRSAYEQVLEVLRSFEKPLALDTADITVLSPDDPLVSKFRRAFSTGGRLAGIRLSRTVIFGEYIEDAFVYKA